MCMIESDLIRKYRLFYEKARLVINDDEIFPQLEDTQFKEFVSQRDWMGVPSFSISKKNMTTSDEGHIGIELKNNKVLLDLWFNGTAAVNRFVNILKETSETEKGEFFDLVSKLDENYKIRILYTEKFFSATANWETELEVKCINLNDEKIYQILEKIKEVINKRDSRQKILPNSQISTVAVSLAEIEIDENNEDKINEALLNLTKLIRLTHNIKSDSQIKKIEKEKDRNQRNKEQALSRAKECQEFQQIDNCSPNDIDNCKKCPHNWMKYLR
jgi:hypothetical protein